MRQMATRGIRFLEDRSIDFDVVEYVYKRKGALRAADAVGWDERAVVKSLVVDTRARGLYFVLVPAHRELSTKKLARVFGVKSVFMAQIRDAERLTGYVQGGISPFGSFTAFPVVMEETLLEQERIAINAGKRGVLVVLSPWDVQELLEADLEDIIT